MKQNGRFYLAAVVAVSFAIAIMLVGIVAILAQPIQSPNPPIVHAVVGIYNNGQWIGSGFAISPKHVMTAAHVLSDFSAPEGERALHKKGECCQKKSGLSIQRDIAPDLQSFDQMTPLKVGDIVQVRLMGLTGETVDGVVVYRNAKHDIGIVELKNTTVSTYLHLKFYSPLMNARTSLVGLFDANVGVLPQHIVSPAAYQHWSGNDEQGEMQPMIVSSPSGISGTSGSAIIDSEGYVIAVHVGHIQRAVSVETPIWKAAEEIKGVLGGG